MILPSDGLRVEPRVSSIVYVIREHWTASVKQQKQIVGK